MGMWQNGKKVHANKVVFLGEIFMKVSILIYLKVKAPVRTDLNKESAQIGFSGLLDSHPLLPSSHQDFQNFRWLWYEKSEN